VTFTKLALQLLAPGGSETPLSILIFHRVLERPDDLFPDEMHAQEFDRICQWMSSWFNVLPLDIAVAKLKSSSLPARPACITFDDGYRDNHDVAMPILRKHGLPATFFIATGFLDGGRMWNDSVIESIRLTKVQEELNLGQLGSYAMTSIADRARAIQKLVGQIKYLPNEQRHAATEQIRAAADVELPNNLMMSSEQVKALHSAGMQIGAHTKSHPILARLTDGEAYQEIEESKLMLEALLNDRVRLFAYPNGKPGEDYLPRDVSAVKRLGFDAAVSTRWGVSTGTHDPFEIRRFTPWDKQRHRFGLRMLTNIYRSKAL
jgi:peptidoglycan/xylan/chitin deacetylase (PgdA/CDA1 family)